jgi:hypothetical protein
VAGAIVTRSLSTPPSARKRADLLLPIVQTGNYCLHSNRNTGSSAKLAKGHFGPKSVLLNHLAKLHVMALN